MKSMLTIHGRSHELILEKADKTPDSVPDEYPGIKPEFYYSYSVAGENYNQKGTMGMTQKSCAKVMNEIHPKPIIVMDFIMELYAKAIRFRLENGNLPEHYIIEKEEASELLNLMPV